MKIGQVYKLWKIKLTSNSAIFKTVYHNGGNFMLFGKIKLHSFEVLGE